MAHPTECSVCGGVTGARDYVPLDLSFCPACVALVRHFDKKTVATRMSLAASMGREDDVLSAITARRWCLRNSALFGARPTDKPRDRKGRQK